MSVPPELAVSTIDALEAFRQVFGSDVMLLSGDREIPIDVAISELQSARRRSA